MKIDQTRLRKEIKNYIRYNETRKVVSIDFDTMCIHIMKNYGRSFSPSQLERRAKPELKKLEGLPVSESMFDEIARFLDEMTLYLYSTSIEKGKERDINMKKRFNKYYENVLRSKRDRKK